MGSFIGLRPDRVWGPCQTVSFPSRPLRCDLKLQTLHASRAVRLKRAKAGQIVSILSSSGAKLVSCSKKNICEGLRSLANKNLASSSKLWEFWRCMYVH